MAAGAHALDLPDNQQGVSRTTVTNRSLEIARNRPEMDMEIAADARSGSRNRVNAASGGKPSGSGPPESSNDGARDGQVRPAISRGSVLRRCSGRRYGTVRSTCSGTPELAPLCVPSTPCVPLASAPCAHWCSRVPARRSGWCCRRKPPRSRRARRLRWCRPRGHRSPIRPGSRASRSISSRRRSDASGSAPQPRSSARRSSAPRSCRRCSTAARRCGRIRTASARCCSRVRTWRTVSCSLAGTAQTSRRKRSTI